MMTFRSAGLQPSKALYRAGRDYTCPLRPAEVGEWRDESKRIWFLDVHLGNADRPWC
jgi:hypothetical protein